MDTYYKECYLEKIYHFEALDILNDLKPGIPVSLKLDKNDFDYSKNIKVCKVVNGGEESKILGVLSDEDSKSMIPFFKSGWGEEIFVGKICFVDKGTENLRIKIVVYIKKK